MKFNIAIVFWGQAFLELLKRYCLPSLLSPHNLAQWDERHSSQLLFYCRAQDWEALQSEAIVQDLKQYIEIQVSFIDEILEQGEGLRKQLRKYFLMSKLHSLSIHDAIADQAALIFLSPDAVFSDGFLPRLSAHAQAGADIVLVPGPVLADEDVSRWSAAQDDKGVWSPQRCIEAVIQCPHNSLANLSLNGPYFSVSPWSAFYRTGPRTLNARFFFLHPLLIRKPRPFELNDNNFRLTIDGEYLYQFPRSETQFVIAEPSDMMAFSVHPKSELRADCIDYSLSARVEHLFNYSLGICMPLNRELFQHEFSFQSESEVPARWGSTKAEDLSGLMQDLALSIQIHEAFSLQAWERLSALWPQLSQRLMARSELPSKLLFQAFFQSAYGLFKAGQALKTQNSFAEIQPCLYALAADAAHWQHEYLDLLAQILSRPREHVPETTSWSHQHLDGLGPFHCLISPLHLQIDLESLNCPADQALVILGPEITERELEQLEDFAQRSAVEIVYAPYTECSPLDILSLVKRAQRTVFATDVQTFPYYLWCQMYRPEKEDLALSVSESQ